MEIAYGDGIYCFCGNVQWNDIRSHYPSFDESWQMGLIVTQSDVYSAIMQFAKHSGLEYIFIRGSLSQETTTVNKIALEY